MVAPASLEPVAVSGIGTSWTRRDAGYWLRRIRALLLALVFVAIAAAMTVGFAWGLLSGAPPVAVVVVAVVLAGVIGYTFVRAWATVTADPPVRRRTRRGRIAWQSVGLANGLLALAGVFVSGLVIVISMPFCLGWALALFLGLARRDYPGEAAARRARARP